MSLPKKDAFCIAVMAVAIASFCISFFLWLFDKL